MTPAPARTLLRRSSRARGLVAALCLWLIAPAALAADLPARQAGGPEIVVEGSTEKKSAWKRAETEHVVVFSDGGEAELRRVAIDLEALYRLMSRLYRQGQTADDTAKLQVTLFDSTEFFTQMGLRNLRSAEGPYATSFVGQRYYDPREGGDVLAASRSDQIVNLNTVIARSRDCEDQLAMGALTCFPYPNHPPIVRTWQGVLYSAFAQHFILTYVPAAYPRWYLDGIGALFSTFAVRSDGSADYARPPIGYKEAFRSYGDLRVGDVLTGRYLENPPPQMRWTPYHAWLLAHYFLYADLKPERRDQFARYMAAVRQGTPLAEAAAVFGDMRKLQREIASYAARPLAYARTKRPQGPGDEPEITPLSFSDAAMIAARIEIGTRLAPAAASASPAGTMPAGETRDRAQWLAQVREKAAQFPRDGAAVLFAAEAECRAGNPRECLALAESVLAGSPDNVEALAWKGMALTDAAIAGPAANRPQALAAARQTIERAIALDGDAPLPLIAYFQSFAKAGEPVPEQAMLGMAKVARQVPAAPAPRLYLGAELVRQGRGDLARQVLGPVLHGGYDSPEKDAARALFAPARPRG
ncbi:tetratricopeptide repeat protein [Novosphingobium album (ex Liu et al. 2023)]|uniref:Uncharacterized protein n=1 Tax=Novosphingobium album (ex Liu et al. 2023) TaxID=3031130 RepID=A0ABT5WVQ3_9SPHN|nr:hypothetical protein [Novosphingobium album (ex Liu et al. 2023)]MDE8653959.1 hypothetical protein [Novosphingobium album (ex Liu et al. 2023)]